MTDLAIAVLRDSSDFTPKPKTTSGRVKSLLEATYDTAVVAECEGRIGEANDFYRRLIAMAKTLDLNGMDTIRLANAKDFLPTME